MVIEIIEKTERFVEAVKKIKDAGLKEKLQKQIVKVIDNPEAGKPMMYDRKGTREVYVQPFRLSYAYIKEKSKIIFLDLYHKDEQ